ncbi:MAG: FAD-binding protein, partial [Bacteroidales bacterium]
FMATGQVAEIDVRKQAIEIFPEHHYQNGGVKIDENARTTITGLYAAGEAAGGVHGGNRLGTNSLADLVVFGKISGEHGAEYAKNVKRPKIVKTQLEEEVNAIRSPLGRDSGVSPYEFSKKLHDVMWEEMHIERSGKGLNRCLEVTAEVAEQFKNVSIPGKSLYLNDAWTTAMEVRSRMVVGEIMTRASLYRTESRAALFRNDYPHVDRKQWDKNVIVKMENGEMKLETSPVVVTIWPTEKIDLVKFPVPGEEHEPGARVFCEV